MQALCIVTADEHCDVQCPCCGQKYSVYYSRPDKSECAECLDLDRRALVEHHSRSPLPSAHPGEAFNVPAWSGPVQASAAALLSGALAELSAREKRARITLVPNADQRRVS